MFHGSIHSLTREGYYTDQKGVLPKLFPFLWYTFYMQIGDRTFEDLSIHQKLQFIHALKARVEQSLPRLRDDYLGLEGASNQELLRKNTLYRCLRYATNEENFVTMNTVYRKLSPGESITLPSRMRCQSIIIMLMVHLFNQYYPRIDQQRVFDIAKLGLRSFHAINEFEASRLVEAVEFDGEARCLYFTFQELKFVCQLNPDNGYGYELTLKKY